LINDRFYVFESKELGRGTFARVHLALDKDGTRLACKSIQVKSAALGTTKSCRIAQEISLLSSISHPNIVEIKDWAHDKQKRCIFIFLTRKI
jgi:serine/threonine protein kinase